MNDSLPLRNERDAYAGFWRRVAAYGIDYLLTLVVSVLIGAYALVAFFFYCVLLESSSWQATLGKRAIGLKVTDSTGGRIGFGRAVGRFVGRLLSALLLCLGFLPIAFTAKRQALHDLMAGTLVAHARLPPRLPAWAIAVIAPLGCLPLLGVLAAIAVPAYRDYTIRAQVTEGLNLAGGYRAAVATAWRNAPREFADFNSDAIGAGLPTKATYVESIELVSGMIVITYGARANEAIQGRVLAIVPALDEGGVLGWACGYGQPQAGFTPVFDGHEGYTDIPEPYIPSGCRRPSPP